MPLLLLCVAGLLGLIVGDAVPADPPAALGSAALCGLAAVMARNRPGWRRLALAVCVLNLGAARAAAPDPPPVPPPIAAASVQVAALGQLARTWLAAGLARAVDEPQASLARGLLLGGGGGLDPGVKDALTRTGLAHLLAIDGFKLVVVSGSLGALLVPLLGRRLAAPLLLAVLGAYVLISGGHPSAVRALAMAGLATVAAAIGRLPDALTSLLLVAVGMLALQPGLLHELGLQLSLVATASLILLYPRLRRRLRRVRLFGRRLPEPIAEPLGLALAVSIGTLPLVLHVFAQVSLISPLAHVLAVPLVAPIMLAATVVGALAALGVPTAPIAWMVWLPTTALLDVARLSAALPNAAIRTGRLPLGAAVALGCGLLAWGIWNMPDLRPWRARLRAVRSRHRRWSTRLATAAAASLVGLLALLVRPDGRLHVTPLAVRGGQAVLIRGPTGSTTLLLSGRPYLAAVSRALADELPVWQSGPDLVLATDADAQAVAAQLVARDGPGRRTARALLATDDRRIDLGGGAVVDIYAPRGAGAQIPSASVSYRATWVALHGQPPAPPSALARSGQS